MTTIRSFFLAAILFLLIGTAGADIKTLTINSDTSSRIHLDAFAFTRTGHLNISVLQVTAESYTAAPPDPFLLGFVLLTEVAVPQVDQEKRWNPRFCILDSGYGFCTFRFNDLSSASHSCRVETPNKYRLVFANCASPLTAVTMTVRTELYNLDEEGSRDYLSAALTYHPHIFLLIAGAYFSILGFWIYVLLAKRTDSHCYGIHLLMAGLLLIKALSFICAFEAKHFVKVTGMPHGLDVSFGVLELASNVGLSAVIFLIESSWLRSVKAWDNAKTMMVMVIAVQVVAWQLEAWQLLAVGVGEAVGYCVCCAVFDVYILGLVMVKEARKNVLVLLHVYLSFRAAMSVLALSPDSSSEYWVVGQEILSLLFYTLFQYFHGSILTTSSDRHSTSTDGYDLIIPIKSDKSLQA